MLTFPPEIIINILSNLDLQTLLACQRTCRKLKEIYDESSRLQYIAELEIAGMVDNPDCAMTVADRLAKLRQREDAWAALQPDFTAKITIPKTASSIYDVTPNVYLLGVAFSPDIPFTRGIQSMRLPSDLDDTATPFIELQMVKHIVDFGTSIEEHDLLAVVTITQSADPNYVFLLEVALLRHSTASLHDEAERPILPVWSVNDIASISIEVCGENLAITVMTLADADARATLHIFNWKTGKRKGKRRIVNNLGLVFLREDLLLMPDTLSKPSFGIYHIPYSTPGVDDERLQVQPLLNLYFPDLANGHIITSIQCRCDPTPTGGGVYPKYAPAKRPFANDPMQAIMITEMRISEEHAATSYVMFVQRKKLIEQLPKDWEASLKVYEAEPSNKKPRGASLASTTQPGDAGDSGEPMQPGQSESDSSATLWEEEPSVMDHSRAPKKLWNEWGRDNARWLDSETFNSVYITSTAGQRFVSIDKASSRSPRHIRVIDFNQYNVRKSVKGDLYPCVDKLVGVDRPGYEDEESPWSRKEPFYDQAVQSNLPYIEMTTKQAYNFNSVLLDEQRILGIRNVNGEDFNPTREVELIHFG